ncbi:Sensor protein lytS [Fibrisoma limi BUZ 3]|uniref:Sensor protein lytS n=1 Tax=Fibrisoma limi BUZ 3 TaxID=1185876 RepID=I2GDY0_9BACT|nr:histidine kinase [Fibrisoma limi]CCH52105.1 Sensor protein lytS [Fibrisoma limi BUZ 3]
MMTLSPKQRVPWWLSLNARMQWHMLLLFPWFIPLVSYLLLGPRYLADWRTFVGATALNLTIGVLCHFSLDSLTKSVVSWYPDLRQTGQRVLLLLLVFLLVTPVAILGGLWLYDHFHLFGYTVHPTILKRVMLFNIAANLVSVGVYESVYSLNKWRENMLEKEQLKKANLQSQFESLKNQVNPHFLFNSLNSLSSLIADEPRKAEEFVDEMSKVYRYLLQTNEGELTTLETELAFTRSYYHLLKTRYGAGIQLNVSVAAPYETYQLPPLTLQMLIENAVKHNVIHVGRPLIIDIVVNESGYLQVRNNLQRKSVRVASNQVGLANISAKYRLLTQTEPTVSDDGGYFTVVLPLLSPVTV